MLEYLDNFGTMIIISLISLLVIYFLRKYLENSNYIEIRTVTIDEQYIQFDSNKVSGVSYIYDKYTSDIYIVVKDKSKRIIASGNPEDGVLFEEKLPTIYKADKIAIINKEYDDFVRMLYIKYNIT